MHPILLTLADRIEVYNRLCGRVLGWTSLLLVIAQFLLVVMGTAFHMGSLFLQESLLYINSLMFLGAAGYVLLADGHVRVDLFYRDASNTYQNMVNLVGALVLLLPAMGLIWASGTPMVLSSWKILEGSAETSGLQAIYLFKSFILLFALGLSLQGVAMALRAAHGLISGEPAKGDAP